MSERFLAAYDAVLARWPVPVRAFDVPSVYGTTRVNASGPPDAPPLVLLPGGGATSTVWFANVAALSRDHRVYAVDPVGGAGRGTRSGRAARTPADLMDWLDTLLDGLGVAAGQVCGHSYGGWLALSYAVHAPARVTRLALLDPTACFGGLRLAYRMRAVPLFVRPSAGRMRAFLRWETGDRPLDPGWVEVMALGAEQPTDPLVLPGRPAADRLRALRVPTLVVLAAGSRSHDAGRVAATARRLLPDVRVAVLPDATHHTLPTGHAAVLDPLLVDFFA